MKSRKSHIPIRIDFTPFVSVALLLIVFFVWLKMAEKPRTMQLDAPGGPACYYGERATVDANLFLLANNHIGFLQYGGYGAEAELSEIDYSAGQLREHLMSMTLNHRYGAIVIITPTAQSTFKNLVDLFDELQIVRPIKYVLNDDSPTLEEIKMLTQYEKYKADNPLNPVLMRLPVSPPRLGTF